MRPNPDAGFAIPCACVAARRAARAVTQLYDRHLHASGVEGTQFALLSVMAALGSSRQASIGQAFALDKTTLSRNLKLMQRNGWIEAAAADDRRERRYTLTDAGQERLAAARPNWQRAQEGLRAAMSAAEWKAMWKAFTVVTAAADATTRRHPQGRRRPSLVTSRR